MKYPNLFKSLFICSIISSSGTIYADNPNISIRFDISNQHNLVTFVPYCKSNLETQISYKLVSSRNSINGTSNTQQSGNSLLIANQEKGLGQLSVNIIPGDTYTLNLEIFENGVLIASQSISYPDPV